MSDIHDDAIIAAHQMSSKLTRLLMEPIVKFYSKADQSLPAQLMAVANITAIMSCMCILEEMFGEEILRPLINQAKRDAEDFLNATRH